MTDRLRVALLLAAAAALASASPLPPTLDTIIIRDWLLAGPFPVGVREGITGLADDPDTFRPVPGETLWTSLVQGGSTTWREVLADSAGRLETDYQDVRWDSLQDYYGIAVLSCAGYAWAEFESPRACRALAVASQLGGFNINGRSYLGDVYGAGWFQAPVRLDSGPNRVLLRLSGFADRSVRFMLVPPPAELMLVKGDATLPDLAADSALTAWCGLPLLNTTDAARDSVRLRVVVGGDTTDVVVRDLPGLGAKKVPVLLSFPAVACDSSVPVFRFTAGVDGSAPETLELAVRPPERPVRRTFISAIDGSCQYYAVTFPRDYDPARRYPVIFTLHGAGVEAWGQANAYRQKDWAFIVAPTNRRPYGFDWQDWGRLDALEVLDTVLARLPIDPDRVLLTGGSMGGHGDWHVGLNHPDRFAVVAPQASWPTHQLYVPWFLQRAAVFAPPGLLAVRDRVLRSDNVPALLGNALNLPFFILHGGDDDNVPTLHGRNFARWLDELDQEFVYREVAGRGHWWTDESLGTTCCDDSALMDYIRERRRITGPRRVRFRTGDLGTSHRAYWVAIDRARVAGEDAAIDARALDSVVRVATENVAQFSLDLLGEPFFAGPVGVEVDGARVGGRNALPARLTFHRDGRGWHPGAAPARGLVKTPRQCGPCRQAMMTPFALVYGTLDPARADELRDAATQEAMRWWLIANGLVEVLPDTAVADSLAAARNLVLFGGPAENGWTRRIADRLPVRLLDDGLHLGPLRLGDSLAAVFVHPNPLHPDRLVLVRMGTDPAHTRLSRFWGLAYSGAGIPDFVVFDESVRRLGWAGVRAAGFFGPDWRFDPASAWVRD